MSRDRKSHFRGNRQEGRGGETQTTVSEEGSRKVRRSTSSDHWGSNAEPDLHPSECKVVAHDECKGAGSQVAGRGRGWWGLLHSSASDHSQMGFGFCSPPACPDMQPPLVTQCISSARGKWPSRPKSPLPIRNVEEGNPRRKRPEWCQPGDKAGS